MLRTLVRMSWLKYIQWHHGWRDFCCFSSELFLTNATKRTIGTYSIEFFTLRHFWQNLAGSNKFCQIWQVNVSVEKSDILEKCNRLEKSKDLDNSYFSHFSNISYFSFHIFLIFPLNFNLKEENDPFCVTFWFLITSHLTFRMVNVSDQWNKSCAWTFSFGFYLSKVQQIYILAKIWCAN